MDRFVTELLKNDLEYYPACFRCCISGKNILKEIVDFKQYEFYGK